MKFYHGAADGAAPSILKRGFDLGHRRKDPGDFGMGIYFTTSLSRARSYGPILLEVEIDIDRMAYIENPYFIKDFKEIEPEGDVEELFYSIAFGQDRAGRTIMKTIHGEDPVRTAIAIRGHFIAKGFTGITTGYSGHETVVFDLKVIRTITWRYEQ